MMNWKKSLLVAGVLASLLAGSAFAATEAEDAATQQKGLEYNNKIEQQAPDMEKGRPGFAKDGHPRSGPGHSGFHGPHGTPGPHHGGKFCGPKGGPGPHHNGEFRDFKGSPDYHHNGEFHRHQRDKMDQPGKLTQEQRQQLAKEREEFFANWQNMSDRERREATEKFIHRVNEERMKSMTDTEKNAFEKNQAAKTAEREKIAKMTEDERHEYFKQKHDKMVKERTKNMTKEEKERFLERDRRQQERMEAFWKKWKQMTPEEKEQWKKAHHRFGHGEGMPAPRGRHQRHEGQDPNPPRPM
jgi:hypothetical protein